MRTLSLLPLLVPLACSAASLPETSDSSSSSPAARERAAEDVRTERLLDVLVFERTTRWSSHAGTEERWVVEARLAGCESFEALKSATTAGDMRFTLFSDEGDGVGLSGGAGGHSGDWGRGFEAYLMLHPSDRDWRPRLGERYTLVPRNEGGAHDWVVAEDATLEL